MKSFELQHKSDFSETTKRWDEFWRGEGPGTLVAAVVPKPGTEPVEKPPYSSGHHGDLTPVVDQIMRWADTHVFLGDAVPYYYLEFAADHFSSLLGVDLTFPDSVQGGWPLHTVTDWSSADIRFHQDGKWWERTVEFAEALKAKADGAIMIASPSLVANLDALVALAGPEKVLVDLVERPDEIEEALGRVRGAFAEILDAFAALFEYEKWGSINRHGMWCDGRINVLQSDFSCMISPEMFDRFVYPSLLWEMQQLDHTEYHLDGPDAIRHAEKICGIEKLDIMQWVPGAGEAQEQDWMWLYKKFDEWGKGQILGGSPERAMMYRRSFRTEKLFLNVGTRTGTLEEQKAMVEEIRNTGRASAGRRSER